jgi:MFS family permease
MRSSPASPIVAHLGFLAFGAFWGVWGASIPRLREVAGVTDAQLGLALLFVGAGALPSMLFIGRVLDRRGLAIGGLLLVVLGSCGAATAAVAAGGMAQLCLCFAGVGAVSGAADVALNTLAGRVEHLAGRPVITPAHATFSAAVVLGSLGAGIASAMDVPNAVPFLVVVVVAGGAAIGIGGFARQGAASPKPSVPEAETREGVGDVVLLLGIGVLGALAFAGENAHQSWSAVFLEDEVAAPAGFSAAGPAVFAAVVALTRLAVARVSPRHARRVLAVGAVTAAAGAIVLAWAPTLPTALVALAIAAAGGAVLFPTLLGMMSRSVPENRRGRATSVVTTVAYLGFLLGPAYVGLLAQWVGLRGAMVGIGALAVVLALLIPFLTTGRWTRRG